MQVIVLNNQDTVVNNYLAEIRDVKVQKDTLRFRKNIERIGMCLAYEVSKKLAYRSNGVVTPLGVAQVHQPADEIVVGSILRAGLPMHTGVLDLFDHADNCFVSAFRSYSTPEHFEIKLDYVATPSLDGKVLLLCDPMLATGTSLAQTYFALRKYGMPKHTHILSVIGCTPGVEYLCNQLKEENATLWCAAVDPELDSHKYIVPGLGDAGDLAFGTKM